MPSNKKNDGLIMQAGILAMAGIIVRIIGLLYNSPMAAILGDEGIGYYNMAYNAYTIVLLISSYSIPSAISKVIAQKLAVKEYRNAILLESLAKQSTAYNEKLIGSTQEILVESEAKRNENTYMGRTRTHRKVFFKSKESLDNLRGKLLNVKILSATVAALEGEII